MPVSKARAILFFVFLPTSQLDPTQGRQDIVCKISTPLGLPGHANLRQQPPTRRRLGVGKCEGMVLVVACQDYRYGRRQESTVSTYLLGSVPARVSTLYGTVTITPVHAFAPRRR